MFVLLVLFQARKGTTKYDKSFKQIIMEVIRFYLFHVLSYLGCWYVLPLGVDSQ
jgi:hypothetical protein